MNNIKIEEFISLKDAAKSLGVTSYTLRNLIFEEDIIDGHKIEGTLFFKKKDFEKVKEYLRKRLDETNS
ncbi:MAG: DNA-binding protein [Candidatus Schekmanbacteria bacterium]|nr:MAG: DNA-binding protein [Candidatus Schekmanbacteria bacterium]